MTDFLNKKAQAWDIISSKYWDSGYNGGPSSRDIDKYLEKIRPDAKIAIIGASTVNLIKAVFKISPNITVIDFSQKMCDCLVKELLPDKCNIVFHDITEIIPENLRNYFDYILADRLINRFTEIEIKKAFTELLRLLADNGEIRTSIRIGLYKRDLPLIQEGKERGNLHNFFDEKTWNIDYSKAGDILEKCIQPHGEIPKEIILEFYRLRGPEKRLKASDIEEYIRSIKIQNRYLSIDKIETFADATDDSLYYFKLN